MKNIKIMNYKIFIFCVVIFTSLSLNAEEDQQIFNVVQTGDIAKLRSILTKDNVNFVNHHLQTPLLIAAYTGHVDIVQLLIDKGANVNHKDDLNSTALMQASMEGHTEIVELLLSHSADIHVMNKHNWNAYMLAVREDHPKIAHLLKSKGARWPSKPDLKVAFIEKSAKGNLAFIKLCIENSSVNVNDRILYGRFIPWESFLPEFLVRQMQGLTALHKAARHGQFEIVKYLLKHGADPDVIEYETQMTAFKMAQENQHTKIIQLLKGIP